MANITTDSWGLTDFYPTPLYARCYTGLFIVVFWFGLRLLFGFAPGGDLVEIILRFIRYAVVGCALTWWAPAAFVRLGLAGRES